MRNKYTIILFIAVWMFSFVTKAEAAVYYVKTTASGSGNGSSWENASGDLQAIINAAVSGDEIWVAAGTYKPAALPGATGNAGARDVAFVLKSGVKIYGGFTGSETDLNQRNSTLNKTELSGDIGTVNDASDNAYHVVLSINNTAETLIDGISITGGNANGEGFYVIGGREVFRFSGGGMFTRGSSATISNVTFSNNKCVTTSSNGSGGALYAMNSSLVITDAVFSQNAATSPSTGGGSGGAVYLVGTADSLNNTSFQRVRFNENTTTNAGGALFAQHFTNPVLSDVTFTGNSGGTSAGAMIVLGNAARPNVASLTNVKFESNTAVGGSGGALMLSNYVKATLEATEFIKNTSGALAGALYALGAESTPNTIEINNSTFSENKSGTSGGAFYINIFNNATFNTVNFIENVAGSTGGAFFVLGSENNYNNFSLINCFFSKNRSATAGGAGYVSSFNKANIDRSKFFENKATNSAGGALFIFSAAIPLPNENIFITNSAFYGNEANLASLGGGAIMVSNNTKPSIINSTFYANKSTFDGGAIGINNSNTAGVNIYNSIFNGNTSNGSVQDIFKGLNGSLNLKYSITQETGIHGVDGVVVGGDPGFANTTPGSPDFLQLNEQSVAIDKGDNTLLPAALTKDLAGNDRFFNVKVDMGAYEFASAEIPTTPQTITFENNLTASYGDADIDGVATASSGLPVVYSSSNQQVAIIVNNKIQIVGAGSTDITASQPGNQTYIAASPVVRTLTVNKIPLVIKPADVTVEQHLPFPAFAVSYNGFAAGENASNLTTAPVVTTTATSASVPGEYDLVASGAVSNNYEITYQIGKLTITTGSTGDIHYVKPTASGSGNGTSWANASGDLQQTINNASIGDQIWVAAGTYKPSTLTGGTGTLGARDVAFVLKSGVKIFGGFAGTETIISERNVTSNTTILSGDLGIANDSSDNAYHVVVSVNNTDNTLLDGFTITAGTANQDGAYVIDGQTISRASGGGIFARGSKAVFSNIIISGNNSASTSSTAGFGGGIYSYASTITLQDVQLKNNKTYSENTLGGAGGAIYLVGNSDSVSALIIKKGVLSNNISRNAGGAINMATNASLYMEDFTFADNLGTNSSGGAIFSRSENALFNIIELKNGDFSRNQTMTGSGGAIMMSYYTNLTMTDVLLSENKCISLGGGLYIQGNTDNIHHNELVLTNVQFVKNIASGPGSGTGGAGNFQNNYNATLNNVVLRENYGNVATGALQISGRVGLMNNFKMKGGGFYNNNTPAFTGAAVVSSNVSYDMDAVTFSGNTAGTHVGALWLSGTGSAAGPNPTGKVSNSLFYNNESKSTSLGGGAIYITTTFTTPLLVNNTFYGNRATNNGGAIMIADNANTSVTIANSILYGNLALTGTGADIFKGPNAAVNLQNSLTQAYGTNGSNGNLVGTDPSFASVDPNVAGFLRLDASSPVIDKGSNSLLPAGITTDLAGNARVVNVAVDMGAYEYSAGGSTPTIPQAITFEHDFVKVYGDAVFNPGAVSSSGLTITYTSSNTDVAVVTNGNIQIVGAGTTTITARQPGNGTYLPAQEVPRILTVSKAALVAKPADVSIVQMTTLPAFAITYTGFVNGDNENSLTVKPTVTTNAVSNIATGIYSLTASGGISNKYEITYQEGTLTITPASVNESKLETWFSNSSTLQVYVDVPSDQSAVLTVYTATGQRVYKADVSLKNGRNNFTVPADRMLPGVYIINVKGNAVKLDKKIIKR
ncbi:MBG domain-containing protein [Gynurincola endophyticus]|uniref:MBG domain-containing protein n=1 Tax=Gynurincola endophyticus TaxID=2479004 RepID=UPI000F8EBA50|nr:MBG domain-containing protein [Gynurincola endophyticus]